MDLIEEVARLLGYDRIGSRIPATGQPGGVPPAYAFRGRVREALVRRLREVRLTTFASAEDLAMTGHDDAVPVANPLQAEEGFLRTQLLPGLRRGGGPEPGPGVTDVAIFETGTVFRLAGGVIEHQHAAFALAGSAEAWHAPSRRYDAFDATGAITALMSELGVDRWSLGDPPGRPFHPGRSAQVLFDGAPIGAVGELHPGVAAGQEVEGRVAAGELVLDALVDAAGGPMVVAEVPRYPPVRRDLAFIVSEEVPAGQVQAAIEEVAGDLLGRCVLFDVFRGDPLRPGVKSLAFEVDLRAPDRTLTGDETEPVVGAIVERLREAFRAELRAG